MSAAFQADTIQLADPTIFQYKGIYYLYGTGGDTKGFLVYTSKNLTNWSGPAGKKNGYALRQGDSYGEKGFWAPQVYEKNDRFYMAYTANEQIAIASSDSPLGPFTQETIKPISHSGKQIDPYVFVDEDGTAWLYHVRLTEGNRIFVAKMNRDMSDIISETATALLHAEKGWENTAASAWGVTEGPTVIKKNATYFLLYSANDFRNKDYAVGYATANNPMGPFVKTSLSPIISSALLGIKGTGHGDLFSTGKNKWMYVLHTHFNEGLVQPRLTALIDISFIQKEQTVEIAAQPKNFSIPHNTICK